VAPGGEHAAPTPAASDLEADVDLAIAADPYRWQIAGDWRRAAEAWRAMGCPYEEARALGEGDEPARRTALELLDRLGGRPLAERIRRALREAGARAVPRGMNEPTRRHIAGLTRREAEVLALLARGLTNAKIATALSRSPRTVEHHVEAILEKLEAASRDDAVAIAQARGLLDPAAEK
jgi:DNA-binding CsgD family transcriptional regulator